MKTMRHLLAAAALAAAAVTPGAYADELRLALGGNVTSMDPHFHNLIPNNNIAEHVYDKLTRFDKNGKLVPALATRWRAVDDTTWEFTLRQGVKFHNGDEVTAEDVVFSLERAGAIANSPGPFTTFVRDIASREAVGRHAVRLKTKKPVPLIPNYMATIYVVSKKAATGATQDDFASGKAAVGSGPFKLVRFARNERIELARHDGYWGAKPEWEKVTLRLVTNDAARVAALLSGDVEAIENVPTLDLDRVKRFGNVVSKTSSRLIYLVMDQDRDHSPTVTAKGGAALARNPFKDWRVRQALSLAIDRKAIVDRVMSGQATAAGQIAPPGMFGHDERLAAPTADADKARQLLKQAGWGEGFEVVVNGPNDRYVNDEQILQAVASMWSRVGVTAKVEAMPIASLGVRARQRNMSVYLSGLASTTGEASSQLRPLIMSFDTTKGTGALNNGRYSNPKVDQAMEQAMASLIDTQRGRFLRDAVQAAANDVALIPLHWQMSAWGLSKKVKYTGRPDEYTLAHEFTSADKP